jgi:hypothetical protein
MKKSILNLAPILLIMLFSYSAIVKGYDINLFQGQMIQSPLLPLSLIKILSYAVPFFELVVVALLIFDKTKGIGFHLSYFIMLLFTLYLITLVMFFGHNIPCACGGILGNMGYTTHIILNVFFTLLSFLAIILNKQTKNYA